MTTRCARMTGLALALILPLLAGCHMPARQADSDRQDSSTVRDAARQQELQRQMDQNRAAAESMRAQMAAQAAAQSFRH
jgi:hypothetical protein